MKKITTTIVWLSVATAMFFAGRGCGARGTCGRDGSGTQIQTRIDTLILRDTLRDTVPLPIERLVVRIDTVWLHPVRDTDFRYTILNNVPGSLPTAATTATDSVKAAVPIERKTYLTADYRAVVEGFRPALIELELYRRTPHITHTTTRTTPPPKWSIGLQTGYGLTPHGAAPYIGVGIQYRVLAW